MDTLYLNPDTWDLEVDSGNNIALAKAPYALAQDAATAIRTFLGECWYDVSIGVPYWTQILGKAPPASLIRAQFIKAALTVPDVVSAKVFFSGMGTNGRILTGQVQITSSTGATSVVGF